MATRSYIFVNGVETSTLPTATDPTDASDIVNLAYMQANAQINSISGTRASPQSVTAAGGIVGSSTATLQTIFVKSNSGAVNITANPQLTASAVVGAERTIIGTSDTDTLQLDDGDGLELNGPCVLGNGDTITLICSVSGTWTEKSRS